MSAFDGLKLSVHDTTANLFGEQCTWTPSTGGAAKVDMVNFSQPEIQDALGDMSAMRFEFYAWENRMEYRAGQFEGLKELADAGTFETVTISGKGDFKVSKVIKIWDGDTFQAKLERV